MKVYIGKYPRSLDCKIYRKYMENKYGFPYENKNSFEKILEKTEDTIQIFYNFYNRIFKKYSSKRKTKIKIHPDDLWGMDHTLSLIILPLLENYRKDTISYGFVKNEDVPDNLKTEDDNYCIKKWHYIIDEMIFAFKFIFEGNDGTNEEEERVQNGLLLFGKYYRSLWQ